MSIPGLLLIAKNQLRSYRRLLRKGLPLLAAFLVFILLLSGEAGRLVKNRELPGALLPIIYAAVSCFSPVSTGPFGVKPWQPCSSSSLIWFSPGRR